jgi:hypothetical protein
MECAAATGKNMLSTKQRECTRMKIIRADSRDSRIVPGFGFLAILASLAVKLFGVIEDVAATGKNMLSTNRHEFTRMKIIRADSRDSRISAGFFLLGVLRALSGEGFALSVFEALT